MSYKTIVVISAIVLSAGVATRFIPQAPALMATDTFAGLPATITTTDGDTYESVSLIRAEPDGYLVHYAPTPGAVGIAKIKFARLSSEMQRQAHYNPAKAREFEALVANASTDLEQQRLAWQQADNANKQAQLARAELDAQISAERAEAMAQLVQAQAGDAPAAQPANSPGRMSGAGFSTIGTANPHPVPDGFQPGDGFQAGAGPAVLGNLGPARGFHH